VGYLEVGVAAKAHPLFEESYALFKEIGEKALAGLALCYLGYVAYQQGKIALARSLLEASVNIQGEEDPNELDNKAFALAHLAQVVAFEGDYAKARALYGQCLAIVKQVVGWKVWTPFYLEGLAAVVAEQGELLWASRLWGTAEALRDGMGTPIPPAYRVDYERSVTSARSQLDEPSFAAAWAEGRAMTLEQVIVARGPVMLPESLTTSQPEASPLEKSFPSDPAGLTSREVEVLRLVAQGFTSAQIAEQLVIGLATVNFHVRSIYSKLGVSSRSAATRFAVEHNMM
jgi:ATP/maltotriose-dependent transcriptional regulator MalT